VFSVEVFCVALDGKVKFKYFFRLCDKNMQKHFGERMIHRQVSGKFQVLNLIWLMKAIS